MPIVALCSDRRSAIELQLISNTVLDSTDINIRDSKLSLVKVLLNLVLIIFNLEKLRSHATEVTERVSKNLYAKNKLRYADEYKLYIFLNI